MKHVGSTNFYPFGFNLEKSGRDFFYIQRREWAVDRRFPNFKSRNLIQIPDTNHSPVPLRSKLHARVGTKGNRVIVKGRMGRSNGSAAVSKEKRSTNYDIVIRKSQRWSRCSGHDQSKTLVGKELNFSKLYWHLITRKDCRLILSHTIHIVYCVALLESWGILGNIVFKLLYKLRPALTHRPTLTLSSMLRFFCHCILLNYERYHPDEGSGGREESTPGRGGGGEYFWEFLVGVCRPVLQILTRFQTKKCDFLHSFSH